MSGFNSSNTDEGSTGTIAANGQSVTLNLSQTSNVGITLSGTWVGTIAIRASVVAGTFDTTSLVFFPIGGGAAVTSATANGTWVVPVGGFSAIQIIATAWTSGSATVTTYGSAGQNTNAGTNVANQGTPSANTNSWPVKQTTNNAEVDFNAGTTGAQTQRVTANITRNGTELSYNAGTTDANTPRVSANVTRNGTELSYGAGNSDANTRRVTISTDQSAVQVRGEVASGSSDSGNPVKISSVVDTGSNTFTNGQRANAQSDTSGAIYVNIANRKTTYAVFTSFNPAVSATDVYTITGSATRTIRVTRIVICGTNTGNTNAVFSIIKRSTANTGGTSTTPAIVPLDSNNAAATAVVRAYTANPTLGTTVGNISGGNVFLPALASTNDAVEDDIDFGIRNTQGVVLRGTAEVLAVNFGGVNMGILSATTLNIGFEWTEEA